MGLRPTKVDQDAAITPRGDWLQCPKRSAMRFQLLRQWTLRPVPGLSAASSTEFRWAYGSPKVMKVAAAP